MFVFQASSLLTLHHFSYRMQSKSLTLFPFSATQQKYIQTCVIFFASMRDIFRQHFIIKKRGDGDACIFRLLNSTSSLLTNSLYKIHTHQIPMHFNYKKLINLPFYTIINDHSPHSSELTNIPISKSKVVHFSKLPTQLPPKTFFPPHDYDH